MTEPLPDPRAPLTVEEKRIFGEHARRHPVTGFILEDGIDDKTSKQPLSAHYQALGHCKQIEETHGKDVADVYRAAVNALRGT
jgi:hypothetical protein